MEVVLTGKLDALPSDLVNDLTKAVHDFITERISLPFLIAAYNTFEDHKFLRTVTSIDTWPKIVQRILESTIDGLVQRGHKLASTHANLLRNIGMKIEGLFAEELEFVSHIQPPNKVEEFFKDRGPTSAMIFA